VVVSDVADVSYIRAKFTNICQHVAIMVT
jgi:hypothetical protein